MRARYVMVYSSKGTNKVSNSPRGRKDDEGRECSFISSSLSLLPPSLSFFWQIEFFPLLSWSPCLLMTEAKHGVSTV